MSLPWWKKQILKVNPNAIESKLIGKIDDETVEYAIKNGYLSNGSSIRDGFFIYPSYVRRCVEIGSKDVLERLASNFDTIPASMKDIVKQNLIRGDFVLSGNSFTSKSLAKDPELWLKTVRQDPEKIKDMYPVSDLEISELERGKFMSEFMGLDIPFENISSLDKKKDEIRLAYFQKNPLSMYEESAKGYDKKDKEIAKDYFLANLDTQVQYVGTFKRLFQRAVTFSEEEENEILQSALKNNYLLQPDDYEFLTDDSELMYRTIMSMEKTFNPGIEKIIELHEWVKQYKWTDEQKRNIGRKLNELQYDYSGVYPNIFGEKEVVFGFIESNPMYIDRIRYGGMASGPELRKVINESSYVVTKDTPRYLFIDNPELLIRGLERNFDEVVQIPDINIQYRDAKVDRRIQQIYLQHGVKPEKITTFRRRVENRRTRKPEILLPDSNVDLKYDKDFILESARKYFPSIRLVSLPITKFSKEEQQEIAELYFKYMDNTPTEMPAYFARDIGVLEKNPYILLEQIKRDEDVLFVDAIEHLSDEQKKKIAGDYIKKNGAVLTKETSYVFKANEYIIDEVITQNPQSYDYVFSSSTSGRKSDIENLKQAWSDGRYVINENSPRALLRDKDVFQYCLENEILMLARCRNLDDLFDYKDVDRIRQVYLKEVQEGDITPDVDTFENLYGEFEAPANQREEALQVISEVEPEFEDWVKNGPPEIQDKEVKAEPELPQEVITPETRRLRIINRAIKTVSVASIASTLARYGVENILDQTDPEIFKSNPDLVMEALNRDFKNIEKVSPIIRLNEEQRKWIIEQAIANNYDMNANSLYIFKQSPKYALFIAENKFEQLQYFDTDLKFPERIQEQLVQRYLSYPKKIILNDNSFDFLRSNEQYIRFSLENSKPEDLPSILNNIDFDYLPDEYRDELLDFINQKIVDGEYDLAENPDIEKLMHTNSAYMQRYLLEHIDTIDEIEVQDIFMSKEFSKSLAEKLLESKYIVSEKTPSYILGNKEFLVKYILEDPTRMSSVDPSYISALFTRNNMKQNPDIRALSKIVPDSMLTAISIYVERWGKDEAIDILGNFGDIAKFLDIREKYSLEEAREELVGVFRRGGVKDVKDAISLITSINIELTEEDFKGMGESLTKNSDLFNELLLQNPSYIKYYTGRDDEVYKKAIEQGAFDKLTPEAIEEYLGNKYITTNTVAMQHFLEKYSPTYIGKYTGQDEKVVEKALELGAFEMLDDKQLEELLNNSSLVSSNKNVILHLLQNRSIDLIEKYMGIDEEVYQKALDLGYKIDIEKLKEHSNLLRSKVMFETVAKTNPECYALKFASMSKEDISKSLDKIYEGQKDFLTPEKKEVFTGLCSILGTKTSMGLDLLRSFNPELVDTIGLDNWRTLIRYSIRHPSLMDLVDVTSNGQLNEFLQTYKAISPMISDEIALGINKFLNVASFYKAQPEFCDDLLEAVKSGEEISEVAKLNLQMLIYNKSSYEGGKVEFASLEDLVASKRAQFLDGIDQKDKETIKNELMQYLFNSDADSTSNLLKRDINSKVVAEILAEAKKTNNQPLQLEAEYMSVLVDTLEQLYYYDGDEVDIRKFAKNIYSADEKDIFKIKKEFSNIKETIRKFYERDAQEELTDIRKLVQDEKHYTFFEKQREDGTVDRVKVIDLSQSKHTLYCHVLGTTVDEMFDRDAGRPTICVSPETDMHEAFYYNNESGIILIFSEIPNGSFIGSSPTNMASNGNISYNDYRVDSLEGSLKQMGIRQSYSGDNHAETLLYRAGLFPTAIKMTGDEPSDEEMKAAKDLERKIFEVTGKKVEIPIVKTQHQAHRVVRYKGNLVEEKEVPEFQERAKKVQKLRKEFMGIIGFEESDKPFIRKDYNQSDEYTIVDGKVYSVVKSSARNYEHTAEKVGMRLEELVYGKDSPITMDIREIEDGEDGYDIVRVPSARNLWKYDRRDGSFNHKTNSMMLKEFLVDHLMCNYQPDNKSFALDTDNTIHPLSKKGAFKARKDFITKDGKPYTSMSYLYFDSESGNNIYRRSFEDYIKNPNASEILSEAELSEFVEKAREISAMPKDEYVEMFQPLLDMVENSEDKQQILETMLARKQNAGRDAEQFVERLKQARQIEQEPDIIEDISSVAFVNDVHGNLSALRGIIEDCKKTGKKTIYVLGDMIGFGPQSNQCLDLLREASSDIEIKCLLGNHEMYSLMGNDNFKELLGFDAYDASKVRSELSPENRAFLEGLPISRRIETEETKIELTHFPAKRNYSKDQDIYIGHNESVLNSQSGKGENYLIYGHEHLTELTQGDDTGRISTVENNGVTYMNLPSSGCVHGKNTSYVTMKLKDGKLEPTVVAVEYDREATREALKTTENKRPHFFGFGGLKDER